MVTRGAVVISVQLSQRQSSRAAQEFKRVLKEFYQVTQIYLVGLSQGRAEFCTKITQSSLAFWPSAKEIPAFLRAPNVRQNDAMFLPRSYYILSFIMPGAFFETLTPTLVIMSVCNSSHL